MLRTEMLTVSEMRIVPVIERKERKETRAGIHTAAVGDLPPGNEKLRNSFKIRAKIK